MAGKQLKHLHGNREARDQQREPASEPNLGCGAAVRSADDGQHYAHDKEAGEKAEVLGCEGFEPGDWGSVHALSVDRPRRVAPEYENSTRAVDVLVLPRGTWVGRHDWLRR